MGSMTPVMVPPVVMPARRLAYGQPRPSDAANGK
jgi:hypothetical protein